MSDLTPPPLSSLNSDDSLIVHRSEQLTFPSEKLLHYLNEISEVLLGASVEDLKKSSFTSIDSVKLCDTFANDSQQSTLFVVKEQINTQNTEDKGMK